MNKRIISRILLVVMLLISVGSSFSYGEKLDIRVIESRGLNFNKGMYSDQIRVLKDFFRARDEKDVTWGYLYDEQTRKLVSKFQKENSIKVTGVVDKVSLDRINDEIIDKRYRLSLREPLVNTKGDIIIVNKSSNSLYHFKNGKIYKVYPVATGKTSDLTPDGKHTVVLKVKNPSWGGASVGEPIPGGDPRNPLGKRWIGISYGGGNKYGIHGNVNEASIGKNLSLGCIRMFNKDVESFYEEVKKGTPVWIGTEEVLIRYGVKFEDKFTSNKTVKIDKKEEIKVDKPEVVEDIGLYFQGEKLFLDRPIMNYKDTNYYPVRSLVEILGGEVFWYDENKSVITVYKSNKVEFNIDSNQYAVNDEYMPLPEDQKPFISDTNNIYVPIRYMMEGLGFIVEWDELNRNINLTEFNIDNIKEPI